MQRPQGKLPTYRHHKARGLAVVRLNGQDHYLGPYGTEASRNEYDRLIAVWLAHGRTLPPPPSEAPARTVTELIADYWRHAQGHYQRDGQPTGELRNIRHALMPLKKLFGHTQAAEFGPVAYKAVRKAMIDSGLCRTEINKRLGKVRRLFRWAVECELVPADIHHRLKAVAPLGPGREGVRERGPVRAVPDADIDAVLPHLPAPVRAMVLLQRLTGMRPGEVMGLTAGAIDRSGELWAYRPARHKMDYLGRSRSIILGPKAQEVIREWIKADPDAPLFSPREWAERRHRERRAARRTPMTPSQRARKPKPRPKRAPREQYDRHSYNQAIARACDRAFPHPTLSGVEASALNAEQRAELAEWKKAHRWHANRLRHTAASAIRREFGLEAAQVILGHAKADTTQIYAEVDTTRAQEIMRRIG